MAKTSKVAPAQLRALGRIAKVRAASELYLVGGCALAFHFNHRSSTDLDLFSLRNRIPFEPFKRLARTESSIRLISESDAMIKMSFSRVPVDIVRYPYAPLEQPGPGPAGFPTAGLKDLAAMKLAAIARRGIRRDFWDLGEILNSGMTLAEAMRAYAKRFKRAESDLYHVARALTYFEDADRDPRWPKGLTARHWSQIKRSIARQAIEFVRTPR